MKGRFKIQIVNKEAEEKSDRVNIAVIRKLNSKNRKPTSLTDWARSYIERNEETFRELAKR